MVPVPKGVNLAELIHSGNGDDPIGMEQPVAEQNNESFLSDQKIIAVLQNFVKERRDTDYWAESTR